MPCAAGAPPSEATAASTDSGDRELISTRAPSSTSAWAVAKPRPRLAPVSR
jgi:hypothetical protein